MKMSSLRFLLLLIIVFIPFSSVWAQDTGGLSSSVDAVTQIAAKAVPGIPAMTVTTNASGGQDYTVTIQILAVMTVLTLLPSFLMMMTAFTRVIVVLAILRQAIGLQSTPSNQIILGLAIFLTIFIII